MRLVSILLLLISIALLPACERQVDDRQLTVFNGLTMGTSYNIKFLAPERETDTAAIKLGIENIFDDINQVMSTYQEDSELSRINRTNNTGDIEISEELLLILSQSLQASWLTNGAFDITVGPLVNLWGFGPVENSKTLPSEDEVNKKLEQTGFEKITLGLNPNTIRKSQPDMYLDLSGIAKGYCVDKIAGYLDGLIIENYLIEVGGEIRAKGKNEKGLVWRIGIEKPVTDKRQVERIILLDNLGMATSGDYRNYFEIDGKRYSHTIDPETGYPVSHNLVSVTVLDKSTAWADAMATAMLVMGPDKAVEFADRDGLIAMFIFREKDKFEERYTESFKSRLVD